MLMAQGACRLAGCDSAQQGGQPAAGAGPIMHPDVPGLGLHLFLGTESHRGDCLLRGAAPSHHVGKPGTGESICRRQHKPLNIRANLDQQVLQECTNHLLFLSFFFFFEQIMFIMLIYFTVNNTERHSCL